MCCIASPSLVISGYNMSTHDPGLLQDTDDMDYLLPQSITELGNCLMQLAATLIFVSIVQPIFLAGGPPHNSMFALSHCGLLPCALFC